MNLLLHPHRLYSVVLQKRETISSFSSSDETWHLHLSSPLIRSLEVSLVPRSMSRPSSFSAAEKRNILIYILGLVLYKFGLEAFNGCILTLATNRYDHDAYRERSHPRTFERVGLLLALNQALQCLGAILIAPLIKHFPVRTVLSSAIVVFAALTGILIVLDSATGGQMKPKGFNATGRHAFSYYGSYSTHWILVIFSLTGLAYGMVESINRVIPRDLVGGQIQKLQKMDALIHLFYAISGAVGAFVTGLVLIPHLGNNNAFIITPILFTAAGMTWSLIGVLRKKQRRPVTTSTKTKGNLLRVFLSFGQSVYIGGKIVCSQRRFLWLFPCYSLSLYAHRYLEDGVAPQVARRYLGNAAWSEIIIGGSNFGELLGSIFLFLFSNSIQTPLPWLRLSAVSLMILWYLPFYSPSSKGIGHAWIIGATLIPVSLTWAISDISLSAYIQSTMTRLESSHENVSVLGSVMAFLYCSYIILYAIANPLIGKYVDRVYKSRGSIRPALFNTVGIQMTLILIIIAVSTLIPKNALQCNPEFIEEEDETDEMNPSDVLIET